MQRSPAGTLSPAEIVREAKLEVMARELCAEFQALTGRLLALCDADLGRATLGAALAETVAALDVYRTYADEDGMAPKTAGASPPRSTRRASGGRTSIPTPSHFCSAR